MTQDDNRSRGSFSSVDHQMMDRALEMARQAAAAGEVPIGAVVAQNGNIIAEAFNQKEGNDMATAHAEMLAIEQACEALKRWRLNDCTLYVTAEPCAMCCGAIVQARVKRVVYGCREPKFGCAHSVYPFLEENKFNHKLELQEGLKASDGETLLKEFFQYLRQKNK